jgi:hypothetical protein
MNGGWTKYAANSSLENQARYTLPQFFCGKTATGLDDDSQSLTNRAPHVRSAGLTAQIWGAGGMMACRQYFFYGTQDRIVRSFVAQTLQHHGATPNLSDRVGHAFARDVWR